VRLSVWLDPRVESELVAFTQVAGTAASLGIADVVRRGSSILNDSPLEIQLAVAADPPGLYEDYEYKVQAVVDAPGIQVERWAGSDDSRDIAEGVIRCVLEEVLSTLSSAPAETAVRTELAVGIEWFVDRTLRALADENSALREELRRAGIRIAFLECQLHALNEAKAGGWPRVQRAILKGIGAICLTAAGAALGGYVEGTASAVGGERAAGLSASDAVAACARLEDLVDVLEKERGN